MKEVILVLGASGQIGTELVMNLRETYGNANVVASDIKDAHPDVMESGPFEEINVMDGNRIAEVVKKHGVTQVYHLVAMLSATAERMPEKGWALNMDSLFHVLNLAKDGAIKKVYWPSSIACFGPNTPKMNTPQETIMEPSTVYGISKQAGEQWCNYYFNKYNVDVRSIRYPGIISWKSEPGGGTTDYAVEIYYEALKQGKYTSFLDKGTMLPMMYMPDAIRATVGLMDAPADQVKVRTSYNLAGISFAPEHVAESIQKIMPDFKLDFAPDFRQAIADSWPSIIDDSRAREDWGWKHEFDLDRMTEDMLTNLKVKLGL
ncbi:NAD-dependent epimerase/dehydratase family protein [Phaeocystidibacter luteus]|uniref:NAD-dependent epimerase/dehydratase family protein n=1 Tax=Phaeocystidibacter luteus TaxID=911197 RepID=A0A6N6RFC0_9FLAO|nr:NAD-dependent epimerase/dehydratase family protein [Phaeocystidibacter luteus]KAB2807009.1 NAD-dependent epimerase/dehydratase family protein [Phaeocystidibacter luteus]